MSKHFFLSSFIATFILISFSQPVHAQGLDSFGSVGNGLQAVQAQLSGITESIQNQFKRLYLKLPGEKSGLAILEQSIATMENTETFSMDGQISMQAKTNQSNNDASFTMNIAGPVAIRDVYDPATAQQDLVISGEVNVNGQATQADAQIKIDGNTMYVLLREIPSIPSLPLEELQGQWIRFEGSHLPEEQAEMTLTYEEQQRLEKALQNVFAQSKVTAAQRETLDDHPVFTFDVILDEGALTDYMRTSMEIQDLTQERQEEQIALFRQGLELLGELRAQMKVDRTTYHLRQFRLPLRLDAAALQNADRLGGVMPLANPQGVEQITFEVIMTLDDFNQPVTFEAPAESTSFTEIFVGGLPAGLDTYPGTGGELPVMPLMDGGPSGIEPLFLPGEVVAPSSGDAATSYPSELPQGLTPEQEALLEQYLGQ